MSTWREAAFVVNYTSTGFEAFSIDQVLRSRGIRHRAGDSTPLAEFLGGQFLVRDIGDSDLPYDGRSRRLVWRTTDGEIVATRFVVKHRVRVKITPPQPGRPNLVGLDHEIPNDLIHNYRMDVSQEDMFSLGYNATDKEINSAKKKISLAYHPDRFSMLDDLQKQILNRRMQEFNQALDKAVAKATRKR